MKRVTAPIAHCQRRKNAINQAITEAGSSIPDWWFHDFRRARVTALAGMGFPPHVCDRLLNYTTGTIYGVATVYQRHEILAERKAALDAWAAYGLRARWRTAADNTLTLRPPDGAHVAA